MRKKKCLSLPTLGLFAESERNIGGIDRSKNCITKIPRILIISRGWDKITGCFKKLEKFLIVEVGFLIFSTRKWWCPRTVIEANNGNCQAPVLVHLNSFYSGLGSDAKITARANPSFDPIREISFMMPLGPYLGISRAYNF